MTFGQYIKELRTKKGFTQRDLAEKTGLDFTYFSKIENDRVEHTPSIRTIQDLAKVLEVDELEIMDKANKLPTAFKTITSDQNALRFFRRAMETVKTTEDWADLLDYLERKNDNKT
jgi:transcriptional regulator with XRE-family HTH domain